jgi:phosphatidate cytidylyltransferase
VLDAGRAWLLVVVLAVWAYDSAAYAVGRVGPGPLLQPHLAGTRRGAARPAATSPHRGRALLGLLVGRPLEGAGLGLLIAFAAPLGDLAESMLKRAAGVKDSGQLPRPRRMLDRVDAFVIVAPGGVALPGGVGIA